MGRKYKNWKPHHADFTTPKSIEEVVRQILRNRDYEPVQKLEYGDHGMESAIGVITSALKENKRIALYADYDVDGTLSCVSWIWFLKAIGHTNFIHYIPCRFKEGYGVNLKAIEHLVNDEKAQVVITMDTGITANTEAEYCRSRGVDFICTDHHKIQPDKMPDTVILNPKQHPDPAYQELCGCGITFVLLRRLSKDFPVPNELWTDLLALAGMATICDIVPLSPVNHRLARMGIDALSRTRRPVLARLMAASRVASKTDESDVGFRLGPRINAVGRLGHADSVIKAFTEEEPDELIQFMGDCNDRRKTIQAQIVQEAEAEAIRTSPDSPILFLGGSWHAGVVGIAASHIADRFWKPTWLFERKGELCKGSARSIDGFDVTDAMTACKDLFSKFGGHRAAGGFSFATANEAKIRERLTEYAETLRAATPELWQSQAEYDCEIPLGLADLPLVDALSGLRPFGHGFERPSFSVEGEIESVDHYKDKKTGEPKHSAVFVKSAKGKQKIMFFNTVIEDLSRGDAAKFLVTVERDNFQGRSRASLLGIDYDC